MDNAAVHDFHKMQTAESEITWAQMHLRTVRQTAFSLPHSPENRDKLLLNLERVEKECAAIRAKLTEGSNVERRAA